MHKESPATLYRIYLLSMLLCSMDVLLYTTDKGGRAADFYLGQGLSRTFI